MAITRGNVILLNGTSSSGKTTIAHALQAVLPSPYMHLSLDGLFQLYPEKYLRPSTEEASRELERIARAVLSGLHRLVPVLAEAGNNLIVDHVLQDRSWLMDCIQLWRGLRVLIVGVKCPLQITEQRERARSDRLPGTARMQIETVHSNCIYDVEVDTSAMSPEESAAIICDLVTTPEAWTAFREICDEMAP